MINIKYQNIFILDRYPTWAEYNQVYKSIELLLFEIKKN